MLNFRSIVLGVALTAPLAAQGSLLPYLPESTVLAIHVPDLAVTMNEFQQMPLAKMWAEEEVQNFLADAKEQVKAQIDKAMAQAKEMHAKGAFPIDPDKLLALRVNGGTFAVTSLGVSSGDFGKMPKIGMVLHLDFGATAEQWGGLVKMGLGMLEQSAAGKVQREQSKVGDVDLVTITPTGVAGMEMGLNVALVGSGIVIGSLKDDVVGLLENLKAKKPVLTETAAYKTNAQNLLTDGAECEVFVRPGPVIDFALAGLRIQAETNPRFGAMVDVDGVERALEALGLRGIQSLGMTSTYRDGKAISKGFVVAPQPSRKGVLAGAEKVLDQSFLKWVPKDAVGYSATTLSPLSLYDALVDALKAYDEKFAEHALKQLAGMEEKLGFTIRSDFFGSLGDTFVSWSMPMTTITSAPEVAMLLRVNDQEKIVKVLKNLAAMTDGRVEIEEGEKRGLKAYQVRVNFDPTNGMGMNPFDMFNPTFAFKNGWLVAGFSAGDVKRVFDRMDREDDPKGDIRGNKEHAAVATSIPKEVQSLSFTDWKANFEGYYQIVTGLLAFVPPNENIPIDMSLLPDAATLTKHLFGSISYSVADGNGFEMTSTGPFGPEVVVGLVGAIAAIGATVATMRKNF